MNSLRRICVFCGSSSGHRPEYRNVAAQLGRHMAENGIGLVYGGGKVGLMGALADAALAAGGEVIGVIPDVLMGKEVGHRGLTELRVVRNLHERKAMMADLSDAFIALPGGFGTYEEFCEVITWSQLSIHRKPCALLNTLGYYNALIAMFDHAVEEGFLRRENRQIVIVDTEIDSMMRRLREWQPAAVEKWIGREDR